MVLTFKSFDYNVVCVYPYNNFLLQTIYFTLQKVVSIREDYLAEQNTLHLTCAVPIRPLGSDHMEATKQPFLIIYFKF